MVLCMCACPSRDKASSVIVPSLGDSAFVDIVAKSGAAFVGTVVARPGRTTDAVPLTRMTAIVRLDSLVAWGSAVDIAPGESITVVLQDTANVQLNTSYAFVGNGVALDTGIVVQETWREAGAQTLVAFRDAHQSATDRAFDRETYDHLPQIALVVWGAITDEGGLALGDSVLRLNRYESAPEWRQAALVPRRVLRGAPSLLSQTLRVLYPGSRYSGYALSPRPKRGDLGVYLLHLPGQFPRRLFTGIDTANTFVLFDRLDARPSGDTARVVNVLNARP